MIAICFADAQMKRRALGRLAGRYSFRSWATGEAIVPESALALLARSGIAFSVTGPATYGQLALPQDACSSVHLNRFYSQNQ